MDYTQMPLNFDSIPRFGSTVTARLAIVTAGVPRPSSAAPTASVARPGLVGVHVALRSQPAPHVVHTICAPPSPQSSPSRSVPAEVIKMVWNPIAFVALCVRVSGEPTYTIESGPTEAPVDVSTLRIDASTAGSMPMIGGGLVPLASNSIPFAHLSTRKKCGQATRSTVVTSHILAFVFT
eukprot:scaffold881_cov123-Isochrysis_galbana.AAC.14